MLPQPKKTSLLALGVTAVICSRALFSFFNDPEGPNLLVVLGTAALIYFLSLTAYVCNASPLKKFFLAILIQILLIIGLYFLFG